MKQKKKHGFTLVELSIVLVIIGLLIGGILAAQSMISTAKLQSVVRTIQQYDIAAVNFETKYNGQVPGDSKLFSPNGDGDGKVNSNVDMLSFLTDPQWQEFFHFWQHLNESGLLEQKFIVYAGPAHFPGDFTGLAPKINYGKNCFLNAFTVTTPNFTNIWTISGGSDSLLEPCLTANEAFSLDAKIDDSQPQNGIMQEMYPYHGPNIGDHLGCDSNSALQYDINGIWNSITGTPETTANPARVECHVAIKAQW